LFVACIALGTVESARHFLLSRMAVASVVEHSEVVSLLRGNEEDGADWLWTRTRATGSAWRGAGLPMPWGSAPRKLRARACCN
jgi:hypothetical protein